MMLRSSSTPILGSLISSSSALFNESPNSGFLFHPQNVERATSPSSSILHTFSCRYSMLSDSSERDLSAGMRRTRSEGNLQDLLSICADDSHSKSSMKHSSARCRDPLLETQPSFSLFSSRTVYEDEGDNLQEEDQISDNFSFSEHVEDSNLNHSGQSWRASQPLFLARGLGIDRLPSGFLNIVSDGEIVIVGGDSGDGNGRDGNYSVKTDLGEEGNEMDVYYKRAIEEDPGNSMILKNYAQFLYQCKKDLVRAEEYYSRAILADSVDADTISQYGKLVWELHGDHERAMSYIEHAANMDQNNSFVQAAYAAFLWETGEEDEVGEDSRAPEFRALPVHVGSLASASI